MRQENTIATTVSQDPDASLLARIQQSDTAAFDTLYLAYRRRLWAFAWRLLRDSDRAEDVVQEVFLSLWQRREVVRLNQSLKVWLFAAVRNRSMDQLRGDRGATSLDDANEHHDEISSAQPSVLETLTRDEIIRTVDAALAALPHQRRVMLALRWHDDMTLADIGALLGVSAVAVHKALAAMERTLRPLLEAYYKDER